MRLVNDSGSTALATQVVEQKADGSSIARFRAGGLLEMAWHLFTWGSEVDAIKPGDYNCYCLTELKAERLLVDTDDGRS